jgi:hypothetical protein
MTPMFAKSIMAALLADELKSRGVAALGQPICEEIIEAIFRGAAEACNRRILSAHEAEELSRRST